MTYNDHTASDNLGLPINRVVGLYSKPTINPAFTQMLADSQQEADQMTAPMSENSESLICEEVTLSDDFFFMDKDDDDKPSKAYINFRNRLFGQDSNVVKVEITRASGKVVSIAVHPDTPASKQDQAIFFIIQALLMP